MRTVGVRLRRTNQDCSSLGFPGDQLLALERKLKKNFMSKMCVIAPPKLTISILKKGFDLNFIPDSSKFYFYFKEKGIE